MGNSAKDKLKALRKKCSYLARTGYECFNLLYDDISEDIANATPGVLRYWESEFLKMCSECRINTKICE